MSNVDQTVGPGGTSSTPTDIPGLSTDRKQVLAVYDQLADTWPVLGRLVDDVAAGRLVAGSAEFDIRLRQTDWWTQQTAEQRDDSLLRIQDPATWAARQGAKGAAGARQRASLADTVRQTALQFNMRLDDAAVGTLAAQADQQNWSELQLQLALGKLAVGAGKMRQDAVNGVLGQSVRDAARAYGVNLSEDRFNQMFNLYVTGKETVESLQARFRQDAASRYPAIAERLQNGETFTDITDPYRQEAARLLERDPNSIDMIGSDFAKALTFRDGQQERMMSISEFGDYVRSNRRFGYENTDQARQKAYELAGSIARLFGKG